MLEDLVVRSFPLGFVKIIHVELPDKGGEIIVLKVLRQDLLTKHIGLLYAESVAVRFDPAHCGVCL